MRQDILINVIFGCESKPLEASIWSELRMAYMFAHARPRAVAVCAKCFANKVHIEMFIKFITLFYWSATYKK